MKFEDFTRQLKNISLASHEKDAIRAHLVSIMDNAQYFPTRSRSIKSPWHQSFFARGLVFASIAILISGGGVVFASNNSLPGDTLYPIKISVAEKIQGAVIVDVAAKAVWNGELLEKRLSEISTLQKQKKLTSSNATIAKIAFDDSAKDLQDSLNTLSDEGKKDIAVAVTTSLLPHFEDYAAGEKIEPIIATTTIAVDPVSTTETDPASTVPADKAKIEDTTPASDPALLTETTEAETNATELLFTSIEEKANSFQDQNDKLSTEIKIEAQIKKNDDVALAKNTSEVKTESTIGAGVTSGTAQTTNGRLFGKVSIGPICPVEQVGVPCPVPELAYTSRGVLIYDKDHKNIIKEVVFNKDGTYDTELAVGVYKVEIKKNGIDTAQGLPKEITITANQKTELNISIDTGIRAVQSSSVQLQQVTSESVN